LASPAISRKTAYAISLATGSGDTLLYEGLKEGLRKLGGEGKRRKAIVVLTDGLDTEVRKSDRATVGQSFRCRGGDSY
jgi:hypothetical protein